MQEENIEITERAHEVFEEDMQYMHKQQQEALKRQEEDDEKMGVITKKPNK